VMFCFLFAVGWTESTRTSGGVATFFDERTLAMVIMLYLRKLVVTPILYLILQNGCLPLVTFWFWYTLMLAKASVALMQRLSIPRPLQLLLSFLPILINTVLCIWPEYQTPIGQHNLLLEVSAGSPFLAATMRLVFDPWANINAPSVVCDRNWIAEGNLYLYPAEGEWPLKISSQVHPPSANHFIMLDFAVLAYIAPYALGFLYGSDISRTMKRRIAQLTQNSWFSRVALGSCLVLTVTVMHTLCMACGDVLAAPTNLLTAAWNFCSTLLLSGLIIGACMAFPGRARRMGGSSLGLFYFDIICPTFNYEWLVSLVLYLRNYYGEDQRLNIAVMALQVALLFIWPYVYGFIFAPWLRDAVQALARIVRNAGKAIFCSHKKHKTA